MSTAERRYPQRWSWDDDGTVIEGVLVGLSWAKGKPEYGGGTIPILRLRLDDGDDRAVWLSGRRTADGQPTGLHRRVEMESPRYGDRIRIERSETEEEFTPRGETTPVRYRPWIVLVTRAAGQFVDLLSGPGLPPAREDDDPAPAAPAPPPDADIPF